MGTPTDKVVLTSVYTLDSEKIINFQHDEEEPRMAVPKNEPTARPVKAPKLADPVAASIDEATQEMIRRSHDLNVETIFDRAVKMKPCNIGIQGTCLASVAAAEIGVSSV